MLFRSGTSVSRLMTRLEALPLDRMSADPATVRSLRELIATINSLASGTSLRQLVTNEVQRSVDQKLQSLAPAPATIGSGWTNMAGMFVQAQLRNWIFSSSYATNLSQAIARRLVSAMVADMGDALTTREIISGGTAQNEAGQQMHVTFTRIDN